MSKDAYAAALARAKKVGTSKAVDGDFMAQCCQNLIPVLVGAVSPKLVWEGATSRGVTATELMRMCHDDPAAVADLQW
jgi:hypothetical protein